MVGVTTSPMQTVLDALDRLGRKHKGSDDRVQAQCPAHDDAAASLSITYSRSSGKVLINCHLGCRSDDVVKAMGLTWPQLSDARDDSESTRDRAVKPEIVATYDYPDELGVVLFQKVRYFPKTFKIRRPDGRGGWVWTLGDTRKVPYNLHLVVPAVAAGKTVVITEGEKDADRVVDKLGMAATCNFEGAAVEGQRSKWRDEYSEHFRGAKVLVIADNDPAGIAHARAIEKSLRAVNAKVRVFLPAVDEPKADISDHFDAGFGLEDLVPLDSTKPEPDADTKTGEATGTRTLMAVPASSVKPRRVRWLWILRIVLGGLTLLAGREGLGKSTIAVALAALITHGKLPGEYYGTPRNVVYIASEDSREFTVVPRLIAAGADLDRVFFVDAQTATAADDRVVLPLDLDSLADLVTANDVALVVLDAATSVMDGKLDGDRDRQMRQALEPVAQMADRTGTAVLGLVHFGKRESSDTGKLILGSIAWSQVARSVLAVASDEETNQLVISNTKANLSPGDTPSVSAVITPCIVKTSEGDTSVGRVKWLGETEHNARDLLAGGTDSDDERADRDEAVEWLREYLTATASAKSADVKKAAHVAGFSDRTLRGARTKLKIRVRDEGFPRITYWSLPVAPETEAAPETEPEPDGRDGVRARENVTTDTTGADQAKQHPSRDSHDSGDSRDAHVPTESHAASDADVLCIGCAEAMTDGAEAGDACSDCFITGRVAS